MSTHATSIFKDPNVSYQLSHLNDKYVVVPKNKAHSNIFMLITIHRLCNKGNGC